MASRNKAVVAIFVTLILALAAVIVIFAMVPSRATVAANAAAAAAGSTVTATVTVRTVEIVTGPTVTAPPPAPVVAFGDGTYRVGADVEAGTYQASDPNPNDPLRPCSWQRLGPDGELLDIGINSGLLFISPDTYGILVAGCGDWTRVG